MKSIEDSVKTVADLTKQMLRALEGQNVTHEVVASLVQAVFLDQLREQIRDSTDVLAKTQSEGFFSVADVATSIQYLDESLDARLDHLISVTQADR